jgi:formyltetrahydrofolate deformylase
VQLPTAPADRARLLISCPDQRGIVAAVSQLLFELGANVVDADQHITGPELGMFFMRLEFDLPRLTERMHELQRAFAPLCERYRMDWRIVAAARPHRIALFVSKQDHCLLELLWAWKSGDIRADVALVVSNHPDLGAAVAPYGIPFHHVPVTPGTKAQAEDAALRLLHQNEVDLVVLARYMQILSGDFVKAFPNRIINIHHSFLPAFVGANPYARAYERGVKLIGATAHYVTADLDAGPIIEQDVHRVGHRDDLEDLVRIGRHVERVVLGRAVRWHLEDRVLVHGNKTVVFS